MDFIIVNGIVISTNEANLTDFVWNEPFIISQKVWFGFGGIPLFYENIKAIEQQLRTFSLQLPKLFKNQRELFRLTKRMINKNRFYRSGHVNFQFFLSNGKINSLITSHTYTTFDFPFSEQGLLINFSNVRKNSTLNLGSYKCHNYNLWRAAKAEALNSQLNNSILLNEQGFICEGISSNIFMIKDGVLVTPSLKAGCYKDVLRTLVLNVGNMLNLNTIEVPEVSKEHLLEMDEVFFISEEYGFQWILGIENKRFVRELSEKIYVEFNNFLKKKVTN